jgi:SAM-dependent methyltransferase
MTLTRLERAKAAFEQKDVKKLATLAAEVERRNFSDPDSARIFNLLGEAHRKNGRIRDALAAYSVAHHPPERSSTSAVYGRAECYAALGDKAKFNKAVTELIGGGRLDTNLTSRLMLTAATLGEEKTLARLERVQFPPEDLNAWYWIRRSTAAFRLGRNADVATFVAKARGAANGDARALLAIAELDYSPDEYWDKRYNSELGQHAPVPQAFREKSIYEARTKRETGYLRDTLDEIFGAGTMFATGVDCGCGSGRMTPFLKERVKKLDCYDISDTALRFARAASKGSLRGLSFKKADLSVDRLPAETYDLVFDFTVVQHQADKKKWKAVLANYAQAAKAGGHVFIIAQHGDDGPNKFPHVRNASAAAYKRELRASGCEIIFDELTPWREMCIVGRKAAPKKTSSRPRAAKSKRQSAAPREVRNRAR